MNNVNLTSKPTVLSASANVLSKRGALLGIFVSAASNTPTITVYDDAAAGTTVPLVTVFTPAVSTWYAMPFDVQNGVYVVISGTVSCTVATQAGA
jgi:hypothetical protein